MIMAPLLFDLLIAVILGRSLCAAQNLTFEQFGSDPRVATQVLLRGDDDCSRPILLNLNTPVGSPDQNHRAGYVCINGVISFGLPHRYCCPSELPTSAAPSFVAPFWSDADTRLAGEIRYEIHRQVRVDSPSPLFQRINTFINAEASPSSTYRARWVLLAEWRDVHPFPHGYGFSDSVTEQNNTFQAMIVTNCFNSYAIFIYGCNSLEWSGSVFPARVGVSSDPNSSASYALGEDAVATLNTAACGNSNHHLSVLYPLGTHTGNCEVFKNSYVDYLLENQLTAN